MVGYAATALGYIAALGGGPLQVREVAGATGVPAPYLSKIVNQLARKGLVTTRRGVGGGVQIAFDPKQLSLLELCEALEDPVLQPRCLLGLGSCNEDVACPAHDFGSELRTRQLDFLRQTTLLDVGLFDAQRRRKGTARNAPAKEAGQKRREPAGSPRRSLRRRNRG
jgi:Rrf2 family protein